MYLMVSLAFAGLGEAMLRAQRREEMRRRDLEKLREWLEQAQMSAQLGGWEWDIARNIVSWSDELFRLYGLQPQSEPITFEGFLGRVHPEDRSIVQQNIERAFENRTGFRFEHRILRPDDTVRWLLATGTVIVNAKGEPVRMVGAGQDITEQHAASVALRDARASAEAANRAKVDFLASMSHELRTPLNAIAGYGELLRMEILGPLTPRQRESLERLQRSQQSLQRLVEDILSFARIEAGRPSLTLAGVDVHGALANVSDIIAPQARERKIDFEYVKSPAGLSVLADRGRVEQIVLNLLTNAIKFTGPAGRVTLSATCHDSSVAITVTDTGIGIPPEHLERVFEPFVQLSTTHSARTAGVGLGLAISRDLARGMGGDIRVTSVVGVGSEFSLILPSQPVADADAPSLQLYRAATQPALGETLKPSNAS
jgi:PAS domain S-box-containing protein